MKDVWKYYDVETGKFVVDRWAGRHLISNSFYYPRDFYAYSGGDLSDAYLFGYHPTRRKIEKYGISSRSLGSDHLISTGEYDDSFYREVVSNVASLNSFMSSQDTCITTLDSTDYASTQANTIMYISDLHLDHKIATLFPEHGSREEIEFFVYRVAKNLYEDYVSLESSRPYLLICGDVSHSPTVLEMFYNDLSSMIDPARILTVLGNHELWIFSITNNKSLTHQQCISDFRQFFKSFDIVLLENDLFVVNRKGRCILHEDEILSMSPVDIEEFCKSSFLRVFGTTGYAGLNPKQNALNGLYRNLIDRDTEVALSKKASDVYAKVSSALGPSELVVVSHMPMKDWCESDYEPNRFYVSGHTHDNLRIVNDELNVYSDNQIGYLGNNFHLKYFLMSGTYDPFKQLEDGIYLIDTDQYLDFYYGQRMSISFSNECEIIMLKRNGFYLFLCQKEKLYFLDGGKQLKATHPMEYYYSKMVLYANQILAATKPFNDYLMKVSGWIKSLGGRGTVHGCIVDIDTYNHVYVNPFDGGITAYWAADMKNKVVYPSIKHLLMDNRPELLSKFENSVNRSNNGIIEFSATNHPIHVSDTSIYGSSKQMMKYQYLQASNVIRTWDETVPLQSDFLIDGDEIIPLTVNLIPDSKPIQTSNVMSRSDFLPIIEEEIKETYTWVLFKREVEKSLKGEDILRKNADMYIKDSYIQYYPQRKKMRARQIYNLLAKIRSDDHVS